MTETKYRLLTRRGESFIITFVNGWAAVLIDERTSQVYTTDGTYSFGFTRYHTIVEKTFENDVINKSLVVGYPEPSLDEGFAYAAKGRIKSAKKIS